MTDLIGRLDAWYKGHREGCYRTLQEGASLDDILAVEDALSLEFPDSLTELLEWSNGQEAGAFESFLENRQLMSIREIREAHHMLTGSLEVIDLFAQEGWWSASWIPFLSNGAGDYTCIDMEGSFTGDVGQIINFYHDWSARDVVAPDFATWLESLVLSLERGLWVDKGDLGWQKREACEVFLQERMPGYPKWFTAGDEASE